MGWVTLEEEVRHDCHGESTRTWAGSPHLEGSPLPLLEYSFVLRPGVRPHCLYQNPILDQAGWGPD